MSSDYDKFMTQWGNNIDSLPPATRLTVKLVLQKFEELGRSTDLTTLNFSGNKLSDITPLSSLTNLTDLYLWSNYISDISSLSRLVNLRELYLRNNPIRDITPLSRLTNLTELSLLDNPIQDISPLSNLTNLKSLCLSINILGDITPLSDLINLGYLHLQDNYIIDLSPLSVLTNLEVTWNDVTIPEQYWLPATQWTSRWILTEPNAELRRFFIQILGYERIMEELQAIELDGWREYSLIRVPISVEDEEDIYLLKMTCPSTGYIHVIRVPPNMNSAVEAISWINWDIHPDQFIIET